MVAFWRDIYPFGGRSQKGSWPSLFEAPAAFKLTFELFELFECGIKIIKIQSVALCFPELDSILHHMTTHSQTRALV